MLAVPKEPIRPSMNRMHTHSKVNAMPSVAEAVVRIAALVMLIALCFQAIHK
jgi:hypothetical protein